MEELSFMTGWDDNLKNPVPEGYIISENIVTSVSYGFLPWAGAFGRMLELPVTLHDMGFKMN